MKKSENDEKTGIFFISVTDKPNSKNRAYSDFVLELCRSSILENESIKSKVNLSDFLRHDQVLHGNIKESLFSRLIEYKCFVILLDDSNAGFNPNVWFEFGAVSTKMDSSIVVIASNETEIPFDINDISVIRIPEQLQSYYDKIYVQQKMYNKKIDWWKMVRDAYKADSTSVEVKEAWYDFSVSFCSNLENALISSNPFSFLYENVRMKSLGLDGLYELLIDSRLMDLLEANGESARYISGEQEAFEELVREVKKAKFSLRTTRFADQSIVAKNTKPFHKDFMNALYDASRRVERCDRIICNNNCLKWHDVVSALKKGSDRMNIYIRKEEHNINFELVIIDEAVAFIHFYQTNSRDDFDKDAIDNRHDSRNQHIKSTLKLTGVNVCRELARIFDRLHHRYNEDGSPKELSRTLLGVNSSYHLSEIENTSGFFTLAGNEFGDTEEEQSQKEHQIREMMMQALNHWSLVGKDKIYMAAGLCLVFSLNPNEIKREFTKEEKEQFNMLLSKYDSRNKIKRFITES